MADQKCHHAGPADRTKAMPVVTAPNNGMSAASGYFASTRTGSRRSAPASPSSMAAIAFTRSTRRPAPGCDGVIEGTAGDRGDGGLQHLTQARRRARSRLPQAMAVASIRTRATPARSSADARARRRAVNAIRQPGSSISRRFATAIADRFRRTRSAPTRYATTRRSPATNTSRKRSTV